MTSAPAQSTPAGIPASDAAATPAGVAARPRRSAPRPTTVGGRERGRFYRMTHPRFITGIIDELRKVVWPSRAETRNLTTVVLIVAVAVGIVLGAVDWGFNRIMENVLLP